MNVDVSLPSNGDGKAIPLPAEPCIENPEAQLQLEDDEQEYEENTYSVTARWYERAAQFDELIVILQQWCKKEMPTIKDLEHLAPFIFGLKSKHSHASICNEEGECCFFCNAVLKLKLSLWIFNAWLCGQGIGIAIAIAGQGYVHVHWSTYDG